MDILNRAAHRAESLRSSFSTEEKESSLKTNLIDEMNIRLNLSNARFPSGAHAAGILRR